MGGDFIKCPLKRRYLATIGLQTRAAIPNNALTFARAPTLIELCMALSRISHLKICTALHACATIVEQ